RINADGSPDTTFGNDGEATINFYGGPSVYEQDTVSGMAIDASGRIIVAATSWGYGTSYYPPHIAVARLNADGSPDASFGNAGTTIVSFGSTRDETAAGVAIDPAGHIVVAGVSSKSYWFGFNGSLYGSLAVARLNAADGSLDQSFGSGGVAMLGNIEPGYYL